MGARTTIHARRDAEPADARFAATYRDHRAFVASVVRRSGVPRDDVEDAVHEVFLVLHARLAALDASASLRPWLSTVAVHVSHNLRRKLGRRPASTTGCEHHAEALSASAEGEDQGERLIVRDALSRLPRAKQEVLLLTALADHTAREIALLTHVSPNTVASRLRAARLHLSALLSGDTEATAPGEDVVSRFSPS